MAILRVLCRWLESDPLDGKTRIETCLEEISPSTPFIDALVKAAGMIQCVPRMMEDIKCVILKIEAAAGKLFDKALHRPYTGLKISQVSRKHIVYIFQQCKKDNDAFGPSTK